MNEDDESSDRLHAAIMEVVESQIADGNPKQTRQTLDRLMSEGYAEDEAKNLIGAVVNTEVFGILKSGKGFNEKRYIKALKTLPKLPK